MLDLVRGTINKHLMYTAGDRILVGVSGGPDSVALVHVLNRLSHELQVDVFIAHLDHSFRGQESIEDADFVRSLADMLGLAAIVEKADVAGFAAQKKLSPQSAAREIRYQFFAAAAKTLGCNKLATAHNANDQAETVLLNLLRGGGPGGLAGIPPVRDGWVTRPLIEVRRAEIEEYCRENGLATRLDKSNLKSVYKRNKIRLELIPLLEREYNAKVVETLVRTSEILRDEEQYLEHQTDAHWSGILLDKADDWFKFDLAKFLELPIVLQRRIIRRAWAQLKGSARNLEFVHLSNMIELLRNSAAGSMLNLPTGIALQKSYTNFSLSAAPTYGADKEGISGYSYELKIPGKTLIPETGTAILAELINNPGANVIGTDEIHIDLDKVNQPLIVRHREPGDWFKPQGTGGSQKLKKFFIDKKIPRSERDKVPVLTTGDRQIVWLAGLRADQRWQVTPDTKRVLKLKIMRNLNKPN